MNTIKRARRITFAEIQEKWLDTEMSGGVEFARSTFNRHKDAIQDNFGIYIDCDRKGGYKYYIGNENVLHEDTVQNWIVSTGENGAFPPSRNGSIHPLLSRKSA